MTRQIEWLVAADLGDLTSLGRINQEEVEGTDRSEAGVIQELKDAQAIDQMSIAQLKHQLKAVTAERQSANKSSQR